MFLVVKFVDFSHFAEVVINADFSGSKAIVANISISYELDEFIHGHERLATWFGVPP